jgi:hypothetical protein
MPTFDPLNPQNGQTADADLLRNQFNSLKGLIDTIPPGQIGPQGPAGADGRSVASVDDDGTGRAVVQMSDGATYGPFSIASGPVGPAGDAGAQGEQGPQGVPGVNGNDGVSISAVTDDGTGRAVVQLSNGTTSGPFTIATGPQGNQGDQGPQGAPGEVSGTDLNNAIGGTSNNSNGVEQLTIALSDPPTAEQCGQIVNKLNELIAALRR